MKLRRPTSLAQTVIAITTVWALFILLFTVIMVGFRLLYIPASFLVDAILPLAK